MDAAPAGWGGRTSSTRVVEGHRPGPLRGSAASAAGRGAGEGGETCRMASLWDAPSTRKNGPSASQNAVVARRKALRGLGLLAIQLAQAAYITHPTRLAACHLPSCLRGEICSHLGRASAARMRERGCLICSIATTRGQMCSLPQAAQRGGPGWGLSPREVGVCGNTPPVLMLAERSHQSTLPIRFAPVREKIIIAIFSSSPSSTQSSPLSLRSGLLRFPNGSRASKHHLHVLLLHR